MPSTYSSNLKIELIANGEQAGTWGTQTNLNLGTALEEAIAGVASVVYPSDANLTLAFNNVNTTQEFRHLVLNVSGSITATRELVVPTIEKQYLVWNNTSGAQSITVKTSAGTGVIVPNGAKMHLIVDGANVVQAATDVVGGAIVSTGSTQTLTNKTLTSPAISTINNTGVLTLPTSTDTLVGRATTDTLTNKTLNIANNTLTGVAPLASPALSGTPTAPTAAAGTNTTQLATTAFVHAERTNTATLTNKTLTSPTITGGTINNTPIGGTTANTGTFTTALVGNGTATAPTFAFSADTNTGIFRPAADALGFVTNGSEKVRIDTAGNVGIGTSSPLMGLHVAQSIGSIVRGGLDGNSNAFIIRNNVYFDAANSRNQPIVTGFQTQITMENSTGAIRFATSPTSDAAGSLATVTERMRIDSAGNVLIGKTTATANGGDLQVSSGITFPATQVPKSNANTLDDYEEGNWTPGWIRNDGGLTFTAGTNNWGRYTKIGRVVHIMCRLQGTLSGTLTGSQRLTGLPFVIREGTDFFNSGALAFNSDLRVNTSIDWALLRDSSFLQVTLNPFTGGTANVYINFTYLTDT